MEYHFSCTVFFDLKDLPKISDYFCYTVFDRKFFVFSRKYASSSFWMIRLPFSPSYFSINLSAPLPSFFYRNVTRKKWTDTIYLASLLCSN